jgi:hypothetical protein
MAVDTTRSMGAWAFAHASVLDEGRPWRTFDEGALPSWGDDVVGGAVGSLAGRGRDEAK